MADEGIVADSCFPYSSGDGSYATCPSKCVDNEKFIKHKCQKESVVQASTPDEIKSNLV